MILLVSASHELGSHTCNTKSGPFHIFTQTIYAKTPHTSLSFCLVNHEPDLTLVFLNREMTEEEGKAGCLALALSFPLHLPNPPLS